MVEGTELRFDYHYSMYYNCLGRLIVLGVVPFILLAYFNYTIYIGMKLPTNLGQQADVREKRRMQESELVVVLVGIVVVFICSNIVRISLNMYETIALDKIMLNREKCEHYIPTWFYIAQAVNDLFLVMNSSANMIIYCCLNSKFRKYTKKYGRQLFGKITCRNVTTFNSAQTSSNVPMKPNTETNTLTNPQ